jgi:hypothetical protein
MDALGTIVPVHIAEGLLHLDVSLTPIYIEAPV